MEGIVDFFREPWTFEFMQRGLLAAAIVSAVASVVGSLVILKGMAFIGNSLPHASFGGVAVAFALGENLYVGGGIAALLTALAIGYISRRGVIRNDTAIGIIFVGAFALGILFALRTRGTTTPCACLQTQPRGRRFHRAMSTQPSSIGGTGTFCPSLASATCTGPGP